MTQAYSQKNVKLAGNMFLYQVSQYPFLRPSLPYINLLIH
jgi:hypothetical protein